MDNDHQSPQDDKWTMPESSRVAPNPVVQPTQINQSERINNGSAPPQVSSQNHSSFGESLIAPQEPSSALSSPQLNKPTHHIYGHQKKRSGIGMRLTFALFGLLLIGGVGYLGMSLINTGQQKIASTLEVAWGDPIYEGNGSDIVEIVKPTSAFVCPDDYTQEGSGGTATCTKTETKTVSPVIYSCPSGYEKSGSGSSVQCSKIVGGTEMSVAATSAYSCDSGYTKTGNGSSTRCTKTETVNLEKSYSCTAGYLKTGEGDAIRCVKSSSTSGTVRGSCPSGYSVSGSGVSTTCTQYISASSNTSYSCPSGYSVSGSSCLRVISATPSVYYYCTVSGYTLSGSSCTKTVKGHCTSGWPMENGSGACTGGGVLIAPSCPSGDSKTYLEYNLARCSRSASSGYTYSCPGGYSPSGSGSSMKCSTSTGSSSSVSYSCPSGYSRSGTTCSRSASATLSCDSGYAKAETGPSITCIKISMDTQSAIVTNICPSGFSESSGKCARTAIVPGGTSYTCSSGYKLSGSRCTKIVGGTAVTTQPSKSFGCPDDFDKSGEGASMKCTKVVTDTQTVKAELVCQDGWFKREVGKSVDCARTASGKKPVDSASKQ